MADLTDLRARLGRDDWSFEECAALLDVAEAAKKVDNVWGANAGDLKLALARLEAI